MQAVFLYVRAEDSGGFDALLSIVKGLSADAYARHRSA